MPEANSSQTWPRTYLDISGTRPEQAAEQGTADVSATMPNSSGPLVSELHDKLSKMFFSDDSDPTALQFPSRIIDKQAYAYKLGSHVSLFPKNVIDDQAEFMLSDSLPPDARLLDSQLGQSLSWRFDQALEGITNRPVNVNQRREDIRRWLLEERDNQKAACARITPSDEEPVESTGISIPSGASLAGVRADGTIGEQEAFTASAGFKNSRDVDTRAMTPMECTDSLMQAYLEDRIVWQLERDEMMKEAFGKTPADPRTTENLTTRLAQAIAIEEAKVALKYADALVCSYSHRVREIVSQLDVSSTTELEQAKIDLLRESVLSSTDTGSKGYPTAMELTDWFGAFDTGTLCDGVAQEPGIINNTAVEAVQGADSKSEIVNGAVVSLWKGRSQPDSSLAEQMGRLATASAAIDAALRALGKVESETDIAAAGESRSIIIGLERELQAANKGLAKLQEKGRIIQGTGS